MRQFPEIIHFLVSLLYVLCFSSVFSIDGDFEILTRVKNTQLIDPEGKLKDWVWVSSDQSPCDWTGVECDNRSKSVVGIDLSWLGLSGGFPSGFCWVRTLQKLNLVGNNLNGSLPFRSLAPCFHLQELRLSDNVFDGELPEFSTGFSQLRVLDLSSNNFTGDIPERYGQFPALQYLSLAGNSLTGTIPPFLGNLTELTHLLLGYNPFKRGGLPSEIGNLSKLEVLWLSGTNLVGEIPESIGNLGSLKNLDLSINLLTGRIPESLGALKSVIQIELYDNRLYGELPESLANLTSLLRLDVSQNNLTGELSEKVSALLLESLNLNDNFFTGEISEVLATNPNLVQLKLFNNSFTGKLPENLGKNSELQDFDVSTNDFTGEFPRYLCYRNKLERIVLFKNRFSGEFSGLYGYCKTLNYVRMADNQFSGEVPARFWDLPVLEFLELNNNKFVGSIPSSLSSKLTKIIISNNDFSGPIPTGICGLSRTIEINLRGNRFSGELPLCLTELKKLQKLDLHGNELRGELLSSVSSWADLTELNLGSNNFTGKIPSELGNLPVLKFLDLSSNSLTGPIPKEFIKLKLNQFNVSNNKLYGEVPSGLDNEVFVSGLLGNPNLCSPDLEPLPPCAKSRPITFYCIAVLIACGLLLLALFAWVLKNRSIFRKKNKTPYKVMVFQRVAFTGDEILRSLTEGNAIASGGSGRVYRVKPKTGQTVAAKLLWDGAEKAETEAVFRSEMAALGRIRHSNIVRLLMCLSGEEMRVLVFEYMEKGSLGEALHGQKCAGLEDWPTRFTIALGTAQGLAYLHQDCVPAIVHRDVKSSNILLDQEMQPRLADFGLAKTLQREADEGEEAAMSRVAGSYGYIAPEYAYTLKVSEKSDVYSFGVVVMELITGKRPLLGNKDIVKWVTEAAISSSPPQNSYIAKLIDPRIKASKSEYGEIEKVLNVALLCTSAFPINRPSMRRVVDLLKDCKQGPPN